MAFSLESIIQDLLSQVWFELTFLLAVSLFASFLFARFGQPKIIGFILVGVVIGPILGIIKPVEIPDGGGTTPSGLPESLQMLAMLGSIVLLFMIGLECDLREIYTKRSILIAVGGVVVPWVAGYYLSVAYGYNSGEAIFIGATLVATSVAVTAAITSEMGLIGTPVVNAILGAAVVDDVLGMVVLGISKDVAVGSFDVVGIIAIAVGAVLFIAIGAWLGTKYLAKLVMNVQISGYRRKLPLSGFVLAISIAFLYAFVAEVVQISAIVGAFVAGTAFASSALRDGLRKGMQYLDALFVPIFFVSLGLAVNLDNLWDVFLFALVLTAVAIVTKVVGCGASARVSGMSGWDSLSVGIGMTPRLEIALVIAYYGLANNIIDGDIYTAVLFMGLVTAIVVPSIFRWSLKKGGHSLQAA